MDLIQKLNALQTLSPDEIVKELTRTRWLYYGNMTLEQHNAMYGQRAVVGADNGPAGAEFWIVAGGNQEIDPYEYRWPEPSPSALRGMTEFWFILWDDYKNDKTFPDRETQLAAKSRP